MGILSTKIKTIKREEITIPNNVVTATTVKNYTRLHASSGLILYTSVTIGYSTPWRQVHALLIMAVERTPGLRLEPPPFVYQTALSDFYVEYQINAYMEKPEERVDTLALLHANIQDLFNEYGVQIMSPHYRSDPPEPVWVPKEKWYESPAKKPSAGGMAM
jgi:small-conductance mechanosensitive channel